MSAIVGKVIRVLNPSELVVNLGSISGVGEFSRFIVFTLGEEVKDPDTGESLGQLEIVKGRAEAKHVQEKMSTIKSTEKKRTMRERQRLAQQPPSPAPIMPRFETVTEEVEVDAPFQGAAVGDLVRVL